MEEAPENGKESSNSAHTKGMNEYKHNTDYRLKFIKKRKEFFYLCDHSCGIPTLFHVVIFAYNGGSCFYF
jgi:hypothetical protein